MGEVNRKISKSKQQWTLEKTTRKIEKEEMSSLTPFAPFHTRIIPSGRLIAPPYLDFSIPLEAETEHESHSQDLPPLLSI